MARNDTMTDAKDLEADLLISGGGLAGMTMAIAAAGAGLRSIVVERMDPASLTDSGFDGRCSAIAFASWRLFEATGIAALIDEHQPILDIRVTDGHSPLFLHYDHRELGEGPFGQMVENRLIRKALLARAARMAEITLLAPDGLDDVDFSATAVRARTASGRNIRARLCIAAEGRRSPLREMAGIGTIGWSYGQTGIVCTVAHEYPHRGIAHERFLPPGPFAILPITGRRSSLVWTERNDFAAHIMGLDDATFTLEMQRRFGDFLGRTEITGPRWSYPLTLQLAERLSAERLVLIADAAHGIHPIAGQGLNLGLRDIAALAEVLADAARLRLDIGSSDVLARYERWRRFDTLSMVAVTDGLTRLFSNDIAPLRLGRDLGLAAVNRLPELKKLFMRHARGTVGELPKLLAGQPL